MHRRGGKDLDLSLGGIPFAYKFTWACMGLFVNRLTCRHAAHSISQLPCLTDESEEEEEEDEVGLTAFFALSS